MPEWSGTTQRWQMAPADALLLYTDGVLDVKVSEHERFGEERLAELLGRDAPASAQEWIDRLRQRLNACQEWPDDVTAVAIEWTPSGDIREWQPASTTGRASGDEQSRHAGVTHMDLRETKIAGFH